VTLLLSLSALLLLLPSLSALLLLLSLLLSLLSDRFVEVSMVALVEHADINVDNVAVLQGTRVGDAMADALVHGTGRR
jgi:hypothetical protein